MFEKQQPIGPWSELAARLDGRGKWSRWQSRHGVLADCKSAAELPKWRQQCKARTDEALGCLVELGCREGENDEAAVLVAVHLLSTGVRALARKVADLTDAPLQTAVSEVAVRIRSYPISRRRRSFAANILLDSRHRLMSDLVPHRSREMLLPPFSMSWGSLEHAVLQDSKAAEVEAVEVLNWAIGINLVPEQDSQLLIKFLGLPGLQRRELAASMAISERTLRRRCKHSLAVLQAAGPRFLADAA